MKKYFFIANIILLTLMAYWGVSGFYAILPPPVENDHPVRSTAGASTSVNESTPAPLSAYQTIMTRNLFKVALEPEALEKKTVTKVDVDSLKPTSLKLKLYGTISASGQKGSPAWAVIQGPGSGGQDLYRPGDTIQNATLKLILRERVVLTIDGQDEVLEMEKAIKNVGTPQAAAPPTASAVNISLKRDVVEKAMTDIGPLLRQVRIRPHFLNGKTDGLRLTRIQPDSILRQMALRSGDVINAVNGEPLTSVNDVMNLFKNIKSIDAVELKIRRNGQQQTLNYRFE